MAVSQLARVVNGEASVVTARAASHKRDLKEGIAIRELNATKKADWNEHGKVEQDNLPDMMRSIYNPLVLAKHFQVPMYSIL